MASTQRGADRVVVNQVSVAPGERAKAGVKRMWYRLCRPDHDRCRQVGIASSQPGRWLTVIPGLEMDELTGCVNASVRPARAKGAYRVIGNKSDCRFEDTLDGGDLTTSLKLPATVVASVVLYPQCDPLATGLAGTIQCPREASALPPSGNRCLPR